MNSAFSSEEANSEVPLQAGQRSHQQSNRQRGQDDDPNAQNQMNAQMRMVFTKLKASGAQKGSKQFRK